LDAQFLNAVVTSNIVIFDLFAAMSFEQQLRILSDLPPNFYAKADLYEIHSAPQPKRRRRMTADQEIMEQNHWKNSQSNQMLMERNPDFFQNLKEYRRGFDDGMIGQKKDSIRLSYLQGFRAAILKKYGVPSFHYLLSATVDELVAQYGSEILF